MGVLDRFRKKQAPPPPTLPQDGMAGAATKLAERLLDVGIDGKGTFDSAQTVADKALKEAGQNREIAVDAIVRDHIRLAAIGGFLTGLGGFATMTVSLPANVAGFYVLATRMAAAIAAVRGYDLSTQELRSAVLLSLVGADADDLLRKAGYAAPSGRLANLAAQRLPGPVLMAVNKGVGFRLVNQVGQKAVARLGRGVPVVGGVVGAGVDAYMLNSIADHVRGEFPPKPVNNLDLP